MKSTNVTVLPRCWLCVLVGLAFAASAVRAEEKGKPKPKAAAKESADTGSATPPIDESQAPIKFVLSAPLGIERAKEDARQIAEILTKALGRNVTAEVVSGGDLLKLISSGKADLAFLSAMQYVEAFELSKGRIAPAAKLVRGGLPFYRSVLFMRSDTKGVSTPRDLKGKKLAFVNEGSASGFQLPRLILIASGLTDLEIRKQGSFLGDHATVCRAVLDRKADAGATISNDRAGGAIAGCAETEPARSGELKVIATSDPIPNDVIVVRPDLPAVHFQATRNALLALDSTPEGKKALADIFMADAFSVAADDDFAMLRATLGTK